MVFEDEICLEEDVWNVEEVARDPEKRVAVKHVVADHEVHYVIHQSQPIHDRIYKAQHCNGIGT